METALLFGNERANNRRHQIADEEKKNVKKIGAKGAISAIVRDQHVYQNKARGCGRSFTTLSTASNIASAYWPRRIADEKKNVKGAKFFACGKYFSLLQNFYWQSLENIFPWVSNGRGTASD